MNRTRTTKIYALETSQDIDVNKQKLTDSEIEGDFMAQFMNLSIIEYMVRNNTFQHFGREIFDKEILTELKEFSEYRNNENIRVKER